MKRSLFALFIVLFSLTAQAQQPSAEQLKQMQEAMARQMQMMQAMVDVRPTKQGFDETVAAIASGAEKRGWKMGEVVDMQVAMRAQGLPQAGRMKVVPECPSGAIEKIARAGEGKAPALACRLTVFEGKDGKTYVMRMNLSAMAKFLQGDLARAMAEVGAQEDELLKGLLQD